MYQNKNGDIEAGRPGQLYPNMMEDPQLRWGFIRKVYAILSVQLLLTVAVCALVYCYHPIKIWFKTSPAALPVYIVGILLPFILMIPLFLYHKKHPLNLVLLGLFTLAISFMVGLGVSYTKGGIILEAAILTAVVAVSLTAYTFWAAKRGKDFSFLGPILFCSVMVLFMFGLIQIFFPLGPLGRMIYGAIGAIIFSGYIVYDTDNLIKRMSYDEYVLASVSLYLDILNLFLMLLEMLRG
ncbi:Protein LIFEGUARD 4 [Ranunculus cassubicifolius]